MYSVINNSGEEVNIVDFEEDVASADNERDLVLGILEKFCQLREEFAGDDHFRVGQVEQSPSSRGILRQSLLVVIRQPSFPF